jgi:hypothetical protein
MAVIKNDRETLIEKFKNILLDRVDWPIDELESFIDNILENVSTKKLKEIDSMFVININQM